MIPNHKWVKASAYLRKSKKGQKCFISVNGKVKNAVVEFGFFGERFFSVNGIPACRNIDDFVDGACDRKSDLSEKPELR